MPTQRIVGLLLLLTCGGCAERTFMPTPDYPVETVAYDAPRDTSEEIAQCQATGTSEKDCYESHFLAPPPPAQVALTALDMLDIAAHTLRFAHQKARRQAHTR
jgi:hypothetical protein